MELVDDLGEGSIPLAAVVTLKLSDPESTGHQVTYTEGLSVVEALGMARTAVLHLEHLITRDFE